MVSVKLSNTMRKKKKKEMFYNVFKARALGQPVLPSVGIKGNGHFSKEVVLSNIFVSLVNSKKKKKNSARFIIPLMVY